MSPDEKICPQCNTKVAISAKFCINCGQKFEEDDFKKEIVEKPVVNTDFNVNGHNTNIELSNENNVSSDISKYLLLFENIDETTDNAISAIKESNWNNALTFIDQSLDRDSSNSDFWALKSYILFKLKNFEDAITSVNISINLNDFSEFAWFCKAIILDGMNEYLPAISCCNEFLILNPADANVIQFKITLNDKITGNINDAGKTDLNSDNINKSEDNVNPSDSSSGNGAGSGGNVNPWEGSSGNGAGSGGNVNPWDNPTTTNSGQNPPQNKSPWDLKVNPNKEFNFTGQFTNHFTEFRDIFTVENLYKLENNHLTPNQYDEILQKIKSTGYGILNRMIQENNINFNSLSAFEKVLLFTKSFVEVDYKAGGADLGNYGFNKINLDDRLDTANQITTLIHELAHHLFAEIFEQSTMLILDTDKTDAIESFVGFSLMYNAPSKLLNEYCAHTVQGRFTPHGYQNYGSFENILQQFDIENEYNVIVTCMTVGNTFSQDLLNIIEPVIDYNVREEIKQQFKKDFNFPPNYRGISLEITDTLTKEQLMDFINAILVNGFNVANENPRALLDFKKQFEMQNNVGGIL